MKRQTASVVIAAVLVALALLCCKEKPAPEPAAKPDRKQPAADQPNQAGTSTKEVTGGNAETRAQAPNTPSAKPITEVQPRLAPETGTDLWVWSLAFSPDNTLLAAGCGDGSVRLWDLRQGRMLHAFEGRTTPAYAVAFSPNARHLAAAHASTIVIHDLAEERQVRQWDAHAIAITKLAWAGDAIVSAGRSVKIWNMQGQMQREIPSAALFALSGDGKRLLTGPGASPLGQPAPVIEWQVGDGSQLAERRVPEPLDRLSFGPDGAMLGCSRAGTELKLWRGAMPDAPVSLRQNGQLRLVRFGTAGRTLISVTSPRTVTVWDTQSGRKHGEFQHGHGRASSVAVSGDSKRFALGFRSGLVIVRGMDDHQWRLQLVNAREGDWVAVVPSYEYRSSFHGSYRVRLVTEAARHRLDRYGLVLEQPDAVSTRLGDIDQGMGRHWRHALAQRRQALGLPEQAEPNPAFQLPTLAVNLDPLPLITDQSEIKIGFRAHSEGIALQRLQIRVNGVPVLPAPGADGTSEDPFTLKNHQAADSVTLPLSLGFNRIRMTVLDARGVRSEAMAVDIERDAPDQKPNLWLVAVGASMHRNPAYILGFPADDADQIATLPYRPHTTPFFKKRFGRLNMLRLMNEEVTLPKLRHIQGLISHADVSDVLVLFMAGHGVMDKDFNLFFGTYEFDRRYPEQRGLPLSELREIVRGCPARRKLILLDLRYAIGLDERGSFERSQPLTDVEPAELNGAVKVFRFGRKPGSPESARAQEEMARVRLVHRDFIEGLARRTGAVVISACADSEYSVENKFGGNGTFTHALLECLRDFRGDPGRDRRLRIGELIDYLPSRVRELTGGRQKVFVARPLDVRNFAVSGGQAPPE